MLVVWNLIHHSILEMAHLQRFGRTLLVYKKALYPRQWWSILLINLPRNLFYSPTLYSLHSFFVNR